MKKRGFCQPVAKYKDKNQAKISTRTSAMSSSVLSKKKRERKKKQQNLTFWTKLYKRRKYTFLLLQSLLQKVRLYCCCFSLILFCWAWPRSLSKSFLDFRLHLLLLADKILVFSPIWFFLFTYYFLSCFHTVLYNIIIIVSLFCNYLWDCSVVFHNEPRKYVNPNKLKSFFQHWLVDRAGKKWNSLASEVVVSTSI